MKLNQENKEEFGKLRAAHAVLQAEHKEGAAASSSQATLLRHEAGEAAVERKRSEQVKNI